MKSVKGRKEGKDKEINREAIHPVKIGAKEVKSQRRKREVLASETED